METINSLSIVEKAIINQIQTLSAMNDNLLLANNASDVRENCKIILMLAEAITKLNQVTSVELADTSSESL